MTISLGFKNDSVDRSANALAECIFAFLNEFQSGMMEPQRCQENMKVYKQNEREVCLFHFVHC